MDLRSHWVSDRYFPHQEETLKLLEEAFDSYDNVMLEAPCASGKTLYAMTCSLAFGNAHIASQQKFHQFQMLHDYPDILKMVSGRSNFKCLQLPKETCARGLCKSSNFSCEYKPAMVEVLNPSHKFAATSDKRGDLYWNSTKHCPYWESKCDALNSNIVIHNRAYLLYETFYAGDFGPRKLLVSDEVHRLERQLLEFVSIVITRENIEDMNDATPAKVEYGLDIEKWVNWLRNVSSIGIPYLIKNTEELIKCSPDLASLHEDKIDSLSKTKKKIEYMLTLYNKNPDNWIIEIDRKGPTINSITFKPIFIHDFAFQKYFRLGKKNLLMSGTILKPRKLLETLGLPEDNTCFIQVPVSLPAENQPLYALNIGKLSGNGLDLKNPDNHIQKMCATIDMLLEIYPEEKGIIHTTTYAVKDMIMRGCKNSYRMLFPSTYDRQDVLEEHLSSKEPTVLVSPSMTEGLDLKDDLSRFQIMVKVPYPYLGDKQLQRRMELDPEYYDWLTCIDVVQSKLRSVRTTKDHADTYLLSSDFPWFIKKNNDMLYNQFTYSYKPIEDFIDSKKELLRASPTLSTNPLLKNLKKMVI